MKVKAIRSFYDKQDKCDRKVDEVFEVTAERFEALNATQYGELVAKVAETRKAAADGEPAPATRKPRRRTNTKKAEKDA